jgi:hypothetical protein
MSSSLRVFRSLPSAVYLWIQSFIPRDYKHFINSCKTILQDIKFETVYYNLNQLYSFQYCSDSEFRERILSLVNSKRFQVSVNLAQFRKFCAFKCPNAASTSIHALYENARNVHKLKLEGILDLSDLECFSNIEELILDNFQNISSTIGLSNITKLTLRNFPSLMNISNLSFLQECSFSNCPGLSDISSLTNIRCLVLDSCPQVVDVCCLGAQYRLSIINCGDGGISSIHSLFRVKYLTLQTFPEIMDVAFLLQGVYSLKLSAFGKLTTLHGTDLPYQSTTFLSIENCYFLQSIHSLWNTTSLKLNNCNGLSQLHSLPQLYSLEMTTCPKLEAFPFLPSLKTVSFINCRQLSVAFLRKLGSLKKITSFSLVVDANAQYMKDIQFPQLESLKLQSHSALMNDFDSCPALKKLSLIGIPLQYSKVSVMALQQLEELSIHNCRSFSRAGNGLEVFSDLTTIKSLTITSHPTFNATSLFPFVTAINLTDCPELTHLRGLKNVLRVTVMHCKKLVDISDLGNNEMVKFYKCDLIQDVSSLENVPSVYISYCKSIQNISILQRNLLRYVK